MPIPNAQMKKYYQLTRVLILAGLLCVVNDSVLGQKTGRLYLSVSQTRTEHSRDSYSISKTITINGNVLLYDEGGRRIKPVHKEYKLSNQEVARLRQLISERNLLISKSVEYPVATGPHTSISLSVEIKTKGKRSLIEISGSLNSKELDNDRVYNNANALLKELTDMIYSKEESKPQ